jgi:hypothetical protein
MIIRTFAVDLDFNAYSSSIAAFGFMRALPGDVRLVRSAFAHRHSIADEDGG